MSLENFNYPYHTVSTENPESGTRVQFGNSYVFTAPPTDPDQRKFILNFPVMKFFTDEAGELDASLSPTFNMKNLIDFYQEHKLYKSFHYMHPVYGQLEVKFGKPLNEPEVIVGGCGAVKAFTIEFIEVV